jgi:hypothetical protein
MLVDAYQFSGARLEAVPHEVPFRLLAAAARSNRLVPMLGQALALTPLPHFL